METKKCFKCCEIKPLIEFYPHKRMADGYLNKCKDCTKADAKYHRDKNLQRVQEADRLRYASNPDKKKESAKQYRIAHKKQCGERSREWVKLNPEKRKAARKRYNENHPGHKSRYEKERKTIDPAFAMMRRLRVRLNHAIRAASGKKATNTIDLIGCTPHQLKEHLESLFKPDMSWENRHRWNIDHKRPCASFDLSDTEQQFECFHYTNLQPLWAEDNLRKGDDFPF